MKCETKTNCTSNDFVILDGKLLFYLNQQFQEKQSTLYLYSKRSSTHEFFSPTAAPHKRNNGRNGARKPGAWLHSWFPSDRGRAKALHRQGRARRLGITAHSFPWLFAGSPRQGTADTLKKPAWFALQKWGLLRNPNLTSLVKLYPPISRRGVWRKRRGDAGVKRGCDWRREVVAQVHI